MKRPICFSMIVVFFFGGCALEPRPTKPAPALSPVQEKWVPGARPYEIEGIRYFPLPDAEGFVEYGKASWYGEEFHGRPTASGLIYDMHAKSAAHKTLPLDTLVRVVNLGNQKSIIVPVIDRGPFVKGRVIDLSYAAAKEMDMIGPGVVDVKVEALARESGPAVSGSDLVSPHERQDLRRGDFTIQIGAFESRDNALNLANRFRQIFGFVNIAVHQDERGRVLYRVQVSKSNTLDEAADLEKRLADMGFPDAFIVRM